MAKFPIDSPNDRQGLVDAVNYALSGPAGLGQNFAGFSSYEPTRIRPTGRAPFTLPVGTTLDASWSLDIPIPTIVETPANPTSELIITFATAFTDPPFQPGDILTLANTLAQGPDPDFYNYYRYAVLSCTTTEVTVTYRNNFQPMAQTWPGQIVAGGRLIRDYYDVPVSTDCNGRVTVSGAGDRVFINGQIIIDSFDYNSVSGLGLIATSATISNVLGNNFDLNVASTALAYAGLTLYSTPGTGDFGSAPTTVTAVIDDTTLLCVSGSPPTAGTVTNVIGDFVTKTAELKVSIDRYKGSPNTEPGSTDYFFTFDGVAAERYINFADSTSGTLDNQEAIFVSIIEQDIAFGYYWYLLDLTWLPFTNPEGDLGGLISNYSSTNDSFTPSGTAATLGSLTTFTGILPTTVTGQGSGSELAIDIYAGGGAYDFATNLSIFVIAPGQDYAQGDTLLITGDQLGGTTPTNDLTLVVEAVEPQLLLPGTCQVSLRSLTAQVIKE